MQHHFLYSGALYCNRKATEVETVLGSCVAVCIYDTQLNMGGINHFLLPVWTGEGPASPRFGDVAIKKLMKKMIDFGSDPKNLVAKIFGGAMSVKEMQHYNVGARNISIAREMLAEFRIPIVASNVGGVRGRKIIFRSNTGEVFLRIIKQNSFEK